MVHHCAGSEAQQLLIPLLSSEALDILEACLFPSLGALGLQIEAYGAYVQELIFIMLISLRKIFISFYMFILSCKLSRWYAADG
jgi:hypothetical protein